MISERCVIGVLLNSHELNVVVACFLNTVEIVVCKITVCAHATKLLGHANMCFINSHTLFWCLDWSFVSPHKFLFGIPPEAIIEECLRVLNRHTRPR